MILFINLFVLYLSIVLHEIMHGWIALLFGDNTAHSQGRLTLNPIKHIDPVGSIVLPLLLYFSKAGFMFGWAKPVPISYSKLHNPKRNILWVSLAGPLTNLTLMLLGLLIFKLIYIIVPNKLELQHVLIAILNQQLSLLTLFSQSMKLGLILLLMATAFYLVLTNLILGIFNLLPIPPLDGSRVIYSLLPSQWAEKYQRLETVGFIILLGLMYFGILSPIFDFLYKLAISWMF